MHYLGTLQSYNKVRNIINMKCHPIKSYIFRVAIWDHVSDLMFSSRKAARGTDDQLKDESKKLNNCKYPVHQKTKDLLQIEE